MLTWDLHKVTVFCFNMCMQDSSEEETDIAKAMQEDKKNDNDGEEKGKNKEEQEEEEEEQEIVQNTFSARVVIHEALHLPVCWTKPR